MGSQLWPQSPCPLTAAIPYCHFGLIPLQPYIQNKLFVLYIASIVMFYKSIEKVTSTQASHSSRDRRRPNWSQNHWDWGTEQSAVVLYGSYPMGHTPREPGTAHAVQRLTFGHKCLLFRALNDGEFVTQPQLTDTQQ